MTIRKLLITLTLAVPSIGCAKRVHSSLPDLVIPRACVRADVVLHECDFKKNPPLCKYVEVDHDQACEVWRTK